MVNYGIPFQDFYRSSDPRWSNKLIRGAVTVLVSMPLSLILVGLLGWFILTGYGLRLLHNVQNGEEHPLPEWNQNREDLNRGFKLFVVGLVWSLPGIVSSALLAGGAIPEWTSAISGLWSLFASLAAPAYYIMMARPDSKIADGLQFGLIIRWTWNHLGQVFLVLVVSIVVGTGLMLASILGIVALVVGLLFTVPLAIFVAQLYNMHLILDSWRAQPIPLPTRRSRACPYLYALGPCRRCRDADVPCRHGTERA